FGPERHLHRVVEDVDAAQHLVAGLHREFDFLGSHSCCLRNDVVGQTDAVASGGLLLGDALFDDAHDVALLHDQELFAVDLDLGARPFAEQHPVADLDVDRDQLAGFVAAAGANRNDLALGGLFLGGVGNDDAAGGFGINALDDDAIVKWTEFHGFASSPGLTFFDVMSAGSMPARGQVFSTPPKEVLDALLVRTRNTLMRNQDNRGALLLRSLRCEPCAGQQASARPFGCVEAGAAHPVRTEQPTSSASRLISGTKSRHVLPPQRVTNARSSIPAEFLAIRVPVPSLIPPVNGA